MASLLVSRMATSSSLRPIVAVIGTTGVGKSDLAVALAQSLAAPTAHPSSSVNASTAASASASVPRPARGVVLSADSMQLYKGLDVITNKVTEAERGGIEHWGLDVVQPGAEGSWELGTWCSEAEKKICTLPLSTLPIVCGGTHYFIQHFLFPPSELQLERKRSQSGDPLALRWKPPGPCPPIPEDMDPHLKTLLDTFWMSEAKYPPVPDDAEASQGPSKPSSRMSRPVAADDHEKVSMWRVLEAVDPNEAQRWHWRDVRKVRRALERWWERGGGAVESLGQDAGRRAKFRTLIFWVYEPMDTLRPRLDKRVDKMVANGLLDEIQELREIAIRLYGRPDAIDHAEGIFQAIGYKEFADLPLPVEEPAADPQFASMLARAKTSTHQYAKSQIKWINKQLLPALREARAHGGDVYVYVVPGGPPGQPIAQEILDKFLSGEDLPDPSTVGHPSAAQLLDILKAADARVPDTADRQVLNARRICEVCSQPGAPYSVSAAEWANHLKSKVHKRHSKFLHMSRDEWIAQERARGQARKAKRERVKEVGEQIAGNAESGEAGK